MALRFIGIAPNTDGGESPTVWVDETREELVFQGWKPGAELEAECAATEVPCHAKGIPDHEAVVRVPARMAPITGRRAMPSSVPTFAELLRSARQSAVHLEMRDAYAVDNEKGPFAEWRAGFRLEAADRSTWWRPWLDLISESVARGVVVRRARIVSEPVSEYIRFEHSGTFTNVAAGEHVRWLPRRRASGLALPGNDFWLIDDRLIRWNHCTGDGASAGGEMSDSPAEVKLCVGAFEAVWSRGIPHDEYKIV